ncbi:hypothetical protein [Paraburkholderia phenazinium]|jgi:hypothetical protein|uniref:Uncharacterized protein n=1 Tax=Paraburkholderia phenazinium TaxID=60549 RepID=A0A1G7UD91_9BURK|nr:hypothetical protein [Paraburkholderia phenazinium]SDG45566.1 hypothetical protein SAMN05216466_103416 [Paraburkholderia phenazinium]
MTESENSSRIAADETRASSGATASRTPPAQRPAGSSRTLWVVLLTLPVTIAALAIAIELFGLLLRLGGQ